MNTNARFVGWYGKGKWGIVPCCLENIGQRYIYIYIRDCKYRGMELEKLVAPHEWHMNDTRTSFWKGAKGAKQGNAACLDTLYMVMCVRATIPRRLPRLVQVWYARSFLDQRDRWHRWAFPLFASSFRVQFDFINIFPDPFGKQSSLRLEIFLYETNNNQRVNIYLVNLKHFYKFYTYTFYIYTKRKNNRIEIFFHENSSSFPQFPFLKIFFFPSSIITICKISRAKIILRNFSWKKPIIVSKYRLSRGFPVNFSTCRMYNFIDSVYIFLWESSVIKRAVCKAILSHKTIPYYSDWNRWTSILAPPRTFSRPWKPHNRLPLVSIGCICLVSYVLVPCASSSSFFPSITSFPYKPFSPSYACNRRNATLRRPSLPFITFHLSLEESTFKLPPFHFTIHCSFEILNTVHPFEFSSSKLQILRSLTMKNRSRKIHFDSWCLYTLYTIFLPIRIEIFNKYSLE